MHKTDRSDQTFAFPEITPELISGTRAMFPELERARNNKRALAAEPHVRRLLADLSAKVWTCPSPAILTYSLYRLYQRNGDRDRFQNVYFERRRDLTAAAFLQFFRPDPDLLDIVQDHLWAICEETNWVLPAHENLAIDLMSSETAFGLAETLELLGADIADEVRCRVRSEIRRRIFDLFLGAVDPAASFWFLSGDNNWTGVCASSIGAALLYCETDADRLCRGLNLVSAALARYLEKAFASDGGSDEGAAYWQYGLINLVSFAELLRARTGGRIDLLAHPKIKSIAAFPLKVQLSPGSFYNHADCKSHCVFSPGFIRRLAARSGVTELMSLANAPIQAGWSMPVLLRDVFFTDKTMKPVPVIDSVLLPATGIFRICSGRMVIAGKAGHNAENHNHNDVGSFVVHAGGEDLLCDPGYPPYTREYFSNRRFELFLQTRSTGHSVPLIGGQEQRFGREFHGRITGFNPDGDTKTVSMEFAGAYDVRSLNALERKIDVKSGGYFLLSDNLVFEGKPLPVEEAFTTWLPVKVRGRTARITGLKSTLTLRIIEPAKALFRVEKHEVPGHEGRKIFLYRIVVDLPENGSALFRMEGLLKRRAGSARRKVR